MEIQNIIPSFFSSFIDFNQANNEQKNIETETSEAVVSQISSLPMHMV